MIDRYIDPKTGDYVDADGGAYKYDDGVLNMLAYSFKISKGSWEGDPLFGHDLDKLAQATDTPENRRLVDIYARDAIAWMIELAYIDTVDVRVASLGGGKVAFEVVAWKSGRKVAAGSFEVPFGVG